MHLLLAMVKILLRWDLNHPLAGEDLHFIGSVLEMRIAN